MNTIKCDIILLISMHRKSEKAGQSTGNSSNSDTYQTRAQQWPSPFSFSRPKKVDAMRFKTVFSSMALAVILFSNQIPATNAQEADLVFKKSTSFNLLTPNNKLATYGIDDPLVEGVACHFTVPEKGGVKGLLGLAEELSNASLACRQIGPISFKKKFEQGDEMFSQRRSIFFKKMRIVRGCDTKRNVLVYLIYTDKLIDGSPKNSTSTVPIMPWGTSMPPKCADFLGN